MIIPFIILGVTGYLYHLPQIPRYKERCIQFFSLLFVKKVSITFNCPYLTDASPDFNQTWIIYTLWSALYVHEVKVTWTFRYQWGQKSYTKVKGHLRSSCKICQNIALVLLQPYRHTFIVVGSDISEGKSHIPRSKVI